MPSLVKGPPPPHHRIVLLFDLDCFYAQCERVRLGLDPSVSLALLQWNSVLAVSYPARRFGIKRGDGWDEVDKKSKGECWAIHLQILEKESPHPPSSSSTQTLTTTNNNNTTTNNNPLATFTTTTTMPTMAPAEKSQADKRRRNPYLKSKKAHQPPPNDEQAAKPLQDDDDDDSTNDTLDPANPRKGPLQKEATSQQPQPYIHHQRTDPNPTQSPPENPTSTTTVVAEEQHALLPTNINEAFDKIYKLSREEQLECQRKERGVRRLHTEGKACLERYRLASMRIFGVVLESLTARLGNNHTTSGKEAFVLERASIDEFYLDITNYCYHSQDDSNDILKAGDQQGIDHTVQVGAEDSNPTSRMHLPFHPSSSSEEDPNHYAQTVALHRACQVSHWVRQDVWKTLGFTMSAGISTNKMMAKLAASYGKPNGQAMLHPQNFGALLLDTKIRKVRHFGGKLGKQVLNVLNLQKQQDAATMGTTFSREEIDDSNHTMGGVSQIPLPTLYQHFSKETATFIFEACRGIDREEVKETKGALVKSITAFKSFTATSNIVEIEKWVSLMANEIVARVAQDSARNQRYPKTCTLNYMYYTTETGQRPKGVTSTRAHRNTRSFRLTFPHEKHPQKVQDLICQAMARLKTILQQQQAIRGVGLSASNFDTRGKPPDGVKGISTFFSKKPAPSQPTPDSTDAEKQKSLRAEVAQSSRDANERSPASSGLATKVGLVSNTLKQPITESVFSQLRSKTDSTPGETGASNSRATIQDTSLISASTNSSQLLDNRQIEREPSSAFLIHGSATANNQHRQVSESSPAIGSGSQDQGIESSTSIAQVTPSQVLDADLELAKKLQASFDRENYVLSTVNRFKGAQARGKKQIGSKTNARPSKMQRIDGFFGKK